ncbi:MAG: hypothetical protein WC989_06075 [Micavibrio sp.]
MDYRDLRFLGYYVHEERGYQSALNAIREEMEARKPDKLAPAGYQPGEKFAKAVSSFGDDYRAYGDGLLERAGEGKTVTRQEIEILAKAERLFALAYPQGLEQAWRNVALLDRGRNMSNTGQSLTERVSRAAGVDLQKDGGGAGFRFEFKAF